MKDDPIALCPECQGAVKRLLYPVGIVFKGSGWYVNDSRAPEKAEGGSVTDKASGESTKESKSDASGEKKTDSSSETKSESKPGTKTETKSESSATPATAAAK